MVRFALVLFALTACGDDGGGTTTADAPNTPDSALVDAPPNAFNVSGTVVGPGAAAGPVVAIWVVTSGTPDYVYKFGDGTSAGTTFVAGFRSDPPTEARNIGTGTDIGVGILALLAPGQSIPDGMVSGGDPAVGTSKRYAVIYRGAADTGAGISWTTQFPIGFSCGRCVTATSGFDTYEPIDCSMLVIDTDPLTDACNFT